ncbi:phosphoserine phosphatase [Pontibacter ummariensis]|uniref:Phosphoserine phosphatase n=1 Tax=Pontibacter ummariensis TaxID=1610492 RepID=A0A239C2F6_9BACT|nr:haloacid dehalogenase-like hydrolase [Pontibacter ummariensis]PRY15496.1 phosphoserine phosphatase [Pontibacter ummariensis]SNS14099.1 Phosphoserine phosphatase [Pontibacter ummariensis]
MEHTGEEVRIAVFDLNGTFYNKHSKDEFFKFICAKEPSKAPYFFQMAYYEILKKLHQISKTEFKENFFNYLDHLSPGQVHAYAEEFWAQEYPANFNQALQNRFAELKKDSVQVYCATGALELYVSPLFRLYPVDGLVGTRVKYENETYKVIGKACKDEEKILRLDALFHGKPYRIVEAYSDSKEVILNEAEKAYLVEDKELVPYKEQLEA